MKNNILMLLMGALMSTSLLAQNETFPVRTPLAGLGFGINATVFPTNMYGETQLFLSIAPCINRHWVDAMAYLGLQMSPKPSGVVAGYQRTVWGMHKKVKAYVNVDAQIGKITLQLPTYCPLRQDIERDIMFLGSVNVGMEIVLPFSWIDRWLAHVQVGIADLEVAGRCPDNQINPVARTGLRMWF